MINGGKKLISENLLLHRRLAKTTINDVRGNREIKNDERGIDADRWRDFPGREAREAN